MRILPCLVVVFSLFSGVAYAGCSKGDGENAYSLGHTLAFQGVDTRAAHHVAPNMATCFAIGYREGTLQRLLRTSQPHPPKAHLIRPRNTERG